MANKKAPLEREETNLDLGLFTEDEMEAAKTQADNKPPTAEGAGKKQRKERPKAKATAKEKEKTKAQRLEDDGQLRLFGNSRRGGARPGAGRPRGNKHPWSLRVTEEEKTALKSMLSAMRGSEEKNDQERK